MNKLLKILLAIVALVILAAVVVPFFIPQEVYKQQIVQAFEKSTGRTLQINGDMSLQFRPSFEFVARDVSLSNAPGATDPFMAEMEILTLGIDWRALFGREISITKLILERPTLSLEVLPNGTANWEFDAAAAQDVNEADNTEASKGSSQVSAISFGDLRLVDGTLNYRNGLTGEVYEISNVDAKIDLPDLSGPFHVVGDLIYQDEEMTIDLALGSLAAITDSTQTPFKLNLSSSLLKANLDGTFTGGSAPLIDATADIDVPSVRNLAAWSGTPLEFERGFGPFSAVGDLRVRGSQYSFENATLSFDDMKGSGALTIKTSGAKPSITGKLTIDTVDIRPYMEKAAAAVATNEGQASQGWSEETLDLSALREFDANFTIKTKALYFQDYEIGAADLLIRIHQNTLTAALNNLDLYAGTAKGTLSFDASRSVIKVGATFAFTGIQAGPLLKAATSKELIEGKGDLAFALTTVGQTQKALMKGLNGKGALTLRDGKIIGADLNRMLQIAAALTPKEAAAPETQDQTAEQSGNTKSTDFVEMGGTFKFVKGVLKTKDLLLINDVLSLAGSGNVDFGRQKVDLRLVPGQNQQDGGTRVAMKVQGGWDNIRYIPDFETVIKDKLRDALIGDKASKEGEEPSDAEQVLKLLDSIFGSKE